MSSRNHDIYTDSTIVMWYGNKGRSVPHLQILLPYSQINKDNENNTGEKKHFLN